MKKHRGIKRINREANDINDALRTLPEISASLAAMPTSHDSAVGYLKGLFTNGMRLVKFREKIYHMKTNDADAARMKTEVIQAIDMALENLLDVSYKVINAIREDEN